MHIKIAIRLLLQISGWPGQQISIPIKLTDETDQAASEFLQLEPIDENYQVSNTYTAGTAVDTICYMQPITKYKIQPRLLYQKKDSLSVTVAVEDSVQADINNNTANTLVVVREFSIGVSNIIIWCN